MNLRLQPRLGMMPCARTLGWLSGDSSDDIHLPMQVSIDFISGKPLGLAASSLVGLGPFESGTFLVRVYFTFLKGKFSSGASVSRLTPCCNPQDWASPRRMSTRASLMTTEELYQALESYIDSDSQFVRRQLTDAHLLVSNQL